MSALLRVPHLIGGRLLIEGDDLRCGELAQGGDPAGDPDGLLAEWVQQNATAQAPAPLPAVLDHGTVECRRPITIADVT
ncbi:MAG TPA: hypothetical protein VL652_01445 [Kutzneria sp.]|nr:hypothetical protein [Kutzneria sp.]